MVGLSENEHRLPRHIFRRVEAELYRYPRYVAALKNYPVDRGDVVHRSREWPPPEGTTRGQVPDPTAGGAIRLEFLAERLRKAVMMVSVINTVYETLSDEQQALVRLKYFDRTHYTNEQIIATMYMDFGTSRSQWYRMRADIVRQVAEEMGLWPSGHPAENAS